MSVCLDKKRSLCRSGCLRQFDCYSGGRLTDSRCSPDPLFIFHALSDTDTMYALLLVDSQAFLTIKSTQTFLAPEVVLVVFNHMFKNHVVLQ